jgi:hypothetical protein
MFVEKYVSLNNRFKRYVSIRSLVCKLLNF